MAKIYSPRLSGGSKKVININRQKIAANAKYGEFDPVICVKQGKTNTYAHSITIDGPCTIIYSPYKPLSCGAKVWIETNADIKTEIHCPECACNTTRSVLEEKYRSEDMVFSHCGCCDETFVQHNDKSGPEICPSD